MPAFRTWLRGVHSELGSSWTEFGIQLPQVLISRLTGNLGTSLHLSGNPVNQDSAIRFELPTI